MCLNGKYNNRPIKAMIQVVHSGFWCRCLDLFISVHGAFGMKLLLFKIIKKTTKPWRYSKCILELNGLDKVENEIIGTHSICIETFYWRFTYLFGQWAKIKEYIFFKTWCDCRNLCLVNVCCPWTLAPVNRDLDGVTYSPAPTQRSCRKQKKTPTLWFLS